MEHVNGRKFTEKMKEKKNKVEEIQLADLASLGSLASNKVEEIQPANLASLGSLTSNIKALLGMLARLPWGRRDMLSSMNGKHGGVSVKYVSLIVSCHWIKVFITAL